MAEEPKKDEKNEPKPPVNKLDGFLARLEGSLGAVETTMDKMASGETGLQKVLGKIGIPLGGDKDMKTKIDNLGIDRAITNFVKIPAYGIAGPLAGIAYAGARLGASHYANERLNAEQYKKGQGKWMKGAEKRVGESDESKAFSDSYLSHRKLNSTRDSEFNRIKNEVKLKMETARQAGDVAGESLAKIELREMKKAKRRPSISKKKLEANRTDFDKVNVKLYDAKADLKAKRKNYVQGVPPVLRNIKSLDLKIDSLKVDKKRKKADKILSYSPGMNRISDFKAKRAAAELQVRKIRGEEGTPDSEKAAIKERELQTAVTRRRDLNDQLHQANLAVNAAEIKRLGGEITALDATIPVITAERDDANLPRALNVVELQKAEEALKKLDWMTRDRVIRGIFGSRAA